MKRIAIFVCAITLSACGTLTTMTNSDGEVSGQLNRKGTYCEVVPRVYSGLAYDFCMLHSQPDGLYVDWFLHFYLLDGLLSIAADTVILPYTIVAQSREGSLRLD